MCVNTENYLYGRDIPHFAITGPAGVYRYLAKSGSGPLHDLKCSQTHYSGHLYSSANLQ